MSPTPQPYQNKDSDPTPVPKALHYIVIGSIIPAIAFGIPHAVLNHNSGAVMGIPLIAFGGLLSLHRSGIVHKRDLSSSSTESGERYEYQILLPGGETSSSVNFGGRLKMKKRKEVVLALVDLGIGLGLLASIILTLLASTWRQDTGLSYIAAYASLPMIVNGFIHAFFFFHYLHHTLKLSKRFRRTSSSPLCSRCQAPMCEATSSPVAEPARSREGMEPVRSTDLV